MKNFYKIISLLTVSIISTLSISLAADVTGIINEKAQSWIINNIIDPLLGLAGAVAFCVFIYGVIMFLKDRSGGGEVHSKNKSFLFWGVIGLFVIFSVWSIVHFLGNVLLPTSVVITN